MGEIIRITGLNKDGFFISMILFILVMTFVFYNKNISVHIINMVWMIFIMLNLITWTFTFRGKEIKE